MSDGEKAIGTESEVQSTSVQEYLPEFWEALKNLGKSGIQLDQQQRVREVWALLSRTGPSTPDVLILDEHRVTFVWFNARYHLQVEVNPNGTINWCFNDQQSEHGMFDEENCSMDALDRLWELVAIAGDRNNPLK